MAADPIHYQFTVPAREGTYHLRLYSVPNPMPTGSLVCLMKQHLDQLPAAVVLQDVVDAIGPDDIQTESETEHGQPRIAEMTLDLNAVAELAPLVAAARDRSLNIWLEIVLEQRILDAPVHPPTGSFVWPQREKLVYWGQLDRRTLKGKVRAQHFRGYDDRTTQRPIRPNDLVRASKTHDGTLSMSFIHWMKCVEPTPKQMLDAIGTGMTVRVSDLFLNCFQYINPAPGLLVADHRLDPQIVLAFTTPDPAKWGELNITISSDGGMTPRTNLSDLYINGAGAAAHPLFIYSASGSDAQSLYRWQDFAQALAELCREFFLTFQIALPTMEAAARVTFNNTYQPAPFDSSMRVLLMPDDEAPLPIYVDPNEDSIEYDPAGAWASSYKVDEPTETDIVPTPASTTATSKVNGGTDVSYKTLFRLVGQSGTGPGGTFVDDPRGIEISTPNGSNVLKPANWATGPGVWADNWSALHAWVKINRWGNIRSILTLTSRGVGIEPFGETATVIVRGSHIQKPVKTFGMLDRSDFPMGRYINALPGVFYSPGDAAAEQKGTVDGVTYVVIAAKRSPNGDTEIKAIEVAPFSYYGSDVLSAPPPLPPPPPPGKRGGPADTPTVNITAPAPLAIVAGSQTISATATNTYGVAQVTVQIDGVLLDTQVAGRSNNTWSFTWDTTKWSGTIASPVNHTVKVTAYDTNGNTATASVTVTVKN